MTPNWKLCRPAVNERQIVSALEVGYIHSQSRASVANIQFPPRPTRGWWVNRLALLTISYHSPHRRFRDRGIDLPDEVRCSPYAMVATSVMDEPYPVKVMLAWRHSTCTVRRLNCLLDEIKPSLWYSRQTICSDLSRTASTDSPYSLTRLASASSHRLISISFANLVRTLAFPVRVSVINLCTHTQSVWRCNIVAFHISAMFTLFSAASSSTKCMCWVSLSFCQQLASSIAAPSCSSDTPVARELASTQTLSSGPSTRHFPRTRSSWRTLTTTTFVIIVVNETLVTLSSQPFVISTALLLINAVATQSHLTTGKSPTSFLQNENTLRRVRTCDTLGTSFPRSHIMLPSSRTVKPSIRAPFCSRSGSLLACPKLAKCYLILFEQAISSLIKTSAMYAEVTCWTVSFFESVASTIARIIDGATLSPKPMRDRQYLFPSRIIVWYSHKDLCTRTCKYALRRSSTDKYALRRSSAFLFLNFCAQTSACTV